MRLDLFRTIEISAAGLHAEKSRVDAAAANLANMNSTRAAGTFGYRPVSVLIRAVPLGFDATLKGVAATQVLSMPQAQIVSQIGIDEHRVYDPGHPHADSTGMVSYPGVNQTQEMLTVVSALRAYEANVAVIQASRTLAAKALDIGAA